MKFGKVAAYNLNPDWSPYFLNYKTLAKAISAEKRYRNSISVKDKLVERDLFQSLLDAEVSKVNAFFISEESYLTKRFKDICSLSEASLLDSDEEEEEHKRSLLTYCCGRTNKHPLKREDLCQLFKDFDSLQNFAQLNFLAIKKILRKHDRQLETNTGEILLNKIKEMDFYDSQSVQASMSEIQILYAERFTGGNPTKALKSLRPRKLSYRQLFTGGLMVGLTIPIFFMFITFFSLYFIKGIDAKRIENVIPVYRATGLPIVFLWSWSILILAYQRFGINYVYILQLNPGSICTYLDILKIASFFSIIWLISFTCFLGAEDDYLNYIFNPMYFPSSIFSLALVAIMLIAIFLPLDIFYRSTRFGFLYSLWNIFISPFGRLYFRDFFLADILTSLPPTLVDMAYTICFFTSGQFLSRDETGYIFNGTCAKYNTIYFSSIFSFLPYWWRFMQCLNKFYYTRNVIPHLINAGKYFSGLVYVAFQVAHSLVDSSSEANTFTTIEVLFIVSRFVNAIYCWVWDVSMDWGLFRSKEKPLLRNILLCKRAWIYYTIIVGDLVLRLFWIFSLFNYLFLSSYYWNPIAVFVEIFRRSIWSFFRVELEALENYEEYRSIDIRVPKLLVRPNKETDGAVPSPNRVTIDMTRINPLHTLKGKGSLNSIPFMVNSKDDSYVNHFTSKSYNIKSKKKKKN